MRHRYYTLLLIVLASRLLSLAQVNDLPRTSPEAVGMRSEQVMAFFDSLLAHPLTEIHSVIVMRHGKVVGEMYPAPFRPEYQHTQFSCSKTFVAAAVGIAIGEKRLRLTDRVVDFFPDELPKVVSWQLASITVEDLLTMRSGFAVDTQMRNRSRQWVRDYLNHPMNAVPGKLFQYDSIDTYLLSAIVQRVTGMTVHDYLQQRVFRHLNIRQVHWEQSPEGITTGGWGLYIQPESLAKFGQLLLQRGQWHGLQLIPARWVDAMMTHHVVRNGNDDYGYQMWSCDYPTAMRADGAYGQYIFIIPKDDVVVVINQCTLNGGARQRSYIWKTLFSGMQSQPLPPSPAWQQLQQADYTLPLLEGQPTNKLLTNYQDKIFALSSNPLGWTALRFVADNLIEVTDTTGRTTPLVMGYGSWATTELASWPLNARYKVQSQFSTIPTPFHASACYAWRDDVLEVKIHYVDWMASVLLRFRFPGDDISIEATENYLNKPFTITGRYKETIQPAPL